MSQSSSLSAAEMTALIGQEVGVSDWFTIDQDRITAFAELTEDRQYIHIDPERAAATPFGTTIAHGFLTLSMLSAMAQSCLPRLINETMGVNYGFDKVRFLAAVPAGSRIRARFTLLAAGEAKAGEMTMKHKVEVEIEGHDRSALIAEWISRQYFRPV